VFLLLSALLSIPVLLVSFYMTRQPAVPAIAAGVRGTAALTNLRAFYSTTLLAFLVQVVCTYLLQGAVVQGAISDLNGIPARLGDSLSAGFRVFVPILAIAFLSYLGMMLGFILLIVPGIMVAVAWAVVVPVKVVEQTGVTESFGRSRALTKGYRWKIFALALLYFVLAVLMGLVTRPLLGASLFRPDLSLLGTPLVLVSWVERVILSAVTAVGIASIYYELRLVKEGAGAEQLAAAFD
jgi:uncharacterized membrane protein